MTAARRTVDANNGRQGDLAAIHIAAKALGWDDDTYRDVMFTVTSVRSSGDMDFATRKRWLAHLQAALKARGLEVRGTRRDTAPRKPWTREQKLLWSLWQQLADDGRVNDRKRPALDAWVKRQTGVDRLEWMTRQQLDLCIVSAKKWLERGEDRCHAASA